MGKQNTKVLNLDELELEESEITIVHEGKAHKMRILSVDKFIEHQRRADEHQARLASGAEGDDDSDTSMARIIELMRDSIQEFFPTLPVGELPTAKMFKIFAFLNEVSQKVNESANAIEDAEGNVQSPEGQTES